MGFQFSQQSLELGVQLKAFMEEFLCPNEGLFQDQIDSAADRWELPPILRELKELAKDQGLWNLWLPESGFGAGLSNLDYAPLAEMMGKVHWASEVFNCSAPDTGNMETLERYGTGEQSAAYIRSTTRPWASKVSAARTTISADNWRAGAGSMPLRGLMSYRYYDTVEHLGHYCEFILLKARGRDFWSQVPRN